MLYTKQRRLTTILVLCFHQGVTVRPDLLQEAKDTPLLLPSLLIGVQVHNVVKCCAGTRPRLLTAPEIAQNGFLVVSMEDVN